MFVLVGVLLNSGSPGFESARIGAMAGHSVFVDVDGALWGMRNNGATLPFPLFDFGVPTVENDLKWRDVAVGWQTLAGIQTDGSLWMWGRSRQDVWGDRTLKLSPTPTRLGDATNWTSVKAGFNSFVALKSDGSLWTWGANFVGQLGDGRGGNPDDKTTGQPEPVRVGADTNWVMIAARVFRASAIKSDGTLWAWGWNVYGELGDGTKTIRNQPVQIGTDTNWAKVFVANDHTFGIKADGTLWVWGENRAGQLGDGTTNPSLIPIQVGTDVDWVYAGGGRDHSLAIKQNGTLWAWG